MMNDLDYQEEVHTSLDSRLLPVAQPVCVDFRSNERIGWETTADGIARPIPYALAADIDTPKAFPDIPERWHVKVQESAEGLYEVANVLERYLDEKDSTHPAQTIYRDILKRMQDRLWALHDERIPQDLTRQGPETGSNETRRKAVIQICEDTNYELEALMGVIQVFEGTAFHHAHGVERIGVYLTFPSNTYVHNYNLNFVMANWLRENWSLPYADMNEINRLSYKYAIDPLAIQSWLENAIAIVWQPVVTTSCELLRLYLDTLLLNENFKATTLNQPGGSGYHTRVANIATDCAWETLPAGATSPRLIDVRRSYQY